MSRVLGSISPTRRLRQLVQHFAPYSASAASPWFPTTRLDSASRRLLHRALSTSSPNRSAAQGTAAWTFTTSAAFHGKPTNRSRRSGPHHVDSADLLARPKSVQQGLAPGHPLCVWRDQHLAEGKAPKEIGAGHDWWFVEGIPSEDEPRGTRGVVLGVAGESRQPVMTSRGTR